jgi:excisionase family DNA binding protein
MVNMPEPVVNDVLVRLVGTKEMAEIMGLNERTVYRLVTGGKIPGYKLGGKWFFDRGMFSSWMSGKIINNCTSSSPYYVRNIINTSYARI